MSSKEGAHIVVGGLSWDTSDCQLEDAFSRFGKVSNAQVWTSSRVKHLYELLIKLSPNDFFQQDGYGGVISMWSNQWLVAKINYADIIDLSNLLFEELYKQSEQLLSGISNLPSVAVSNVNDCLSSDAKFSSDDFLLLLRCSMIIMQFLEFDLCLVLERCQILVAILRKLCFPISPLQFPNQCARYIDVVNPEAGISTNFAFAILEVFLNELLMDYKLRKHFIMADRAFAMKAKLFLHHGQGDLQVIMELVSSHFLISFYDELAFSSFIHSLSWSNEVENHIPVLGLNSALTLLSYPVILSAPHLLQAHLILLVSRCIGIHMPAHPKKLDALGINLCIRALEISVKLYSGYMPLVNFFGDVTGDVSKSSFGAKVLSFDACIHSLTSGKLRQQINMLNLPLHGSHVGSGMKILENSIAYIKGNQNFIDERFRDDACSILTCIVKSTLPGDSELFQEGEKGIQPEVYCVAATLKLMSSSLLQIVWFLKQNGYSAGTTTSKQILICKEYDFIFDIISCFGNYHVEQRIQKLLFGVMERTTGGHKETKLMFSHLASFLSYSFRKQVDFLWKGCIFMMVSLMNLLIFEDGNLDAFRPLLCDIKGPTFTRASRENFLKDSVHKSSSLTIASNLKKARAQIKYSRYEDHRTCIGESTEMEAPDGKSNLSNMLQQTNGTENHDTVTAANTCTGEIYLKCLGYHNNHSDVEDLADFIVCEQGKDYSTWLQKRARFRVWREKRLQVERKKMKRKKRRSLSNPEKRARFREEKKRMQVKRKKKIRSSLSCRRF